MNNDGSDRIATLLENALAKDRASLIEACRRLKVPILAAAIHAGASWDDASSFVKPALQRFVDRLLQGHAQPHDWKSEVAREVEATVQMSSEPEAAGLTGLASIPRLAKRRAVRQTLKELSLSELTAVMTRHMDDVGVDEMVGIVADSREEVIDVLAGAHEKLMATMASIEDVSQD